MRILGVDFGTKRIGIALSDDGGTLAFPKETILNNGNILKRIGEIIAEEQISEIVIGESLDFSGEENVVNEHIKKFIVAVEKNFDVMVFKEKEFLTSFEAHGRKGKEANNARVTSFKKPTELDASAAALILQRYLDKKNNLKE